MMNQFQPRPRTAAEQSETTEPQSKQRRPLPASQGGQVAPSLQQPPSTPNSSTEQPYLHVPPSLPGIPALPGVQKKVQLTSSPLPQGNPRRLRDWAGSPNRAQQMDKFVPHDISTIPGSTNRLGNNGNFAALSSSSQSNSYGSVGSSGSGIPPNPTSFIVARQSGNASFGSVSGSYSPGNRQPPRGKRRKRLPMWVRIAIGLLVFLIIVTGRAFAYYETQLAPSLDNILGKQAIHHNTSDGQTDIQDGAGTAPTGRTNILLLGSDTDGKGNDPNNGGIALAQTVMIITVDPQTKYVGMLSIPRDMQVTEKGYRGPKLDEVFAHAFTGSSLQDKVASGAGEMENIIRRNFGIYIDHYAWVGLSGFVKVMDTVGGIDVDTIHPMVDDSYPDDIGNTNGSIYDSKRLYIAPGPQHLNGVQALEYVRTRHSDLIGDFGRTIRQQQVISQLKIKLVTPDSLGKASELLRDLNGAIQTDMNLNDIVGLGNLAHDVDSNSIDHLTLGPPQYAYDPQNGTTNYFPNCDNIVPAIQKMFNIASPKCLSQAKSNTSSVAYNTPSATSSMLTPLITTPEPKQGATAKNNAISHTGDVSLSTGVHSLLDLVFATTFESFNGLQI